MTIQYEYESQRQALKSDKVGMTVRMGAKDAAGKRPLDSLHVMTKVATARQYRDGEPVWVNTVEMRPATEAEKRLALINGLREEMSGLNILINFDGRDHAKHPDRMARVGAITAQLAEMGEPQW